MSISSCLDRSNPLPFLPPRVPLAQKETLYPRDALNPEFAHQLFLESHASLSEYTKDFSDKLVEIKFNSLKEKNPYEPLTQGGLKALKKIDAICINTSYMGERSFQALIDPKIKNGQSSSSIDALMLHNQDGRDRLLTRYTNNTIRKTLSLDLYKKLQCLCENAKKAKKVFHNNQDFITSYSDFLPHKYQEKWTRSSIKLINAIVQGKLFAGSIIDKNSKSKVSYARIDGDVCVEKISFFKPEYEKQIKDALALALKIDSPYVVRPKMLGINSSPPLKELKNICCYFPLADEGDLLHASQKENFNQQKLLQALYSIFFGVKAFHEKDYIHRDLKLENFLVFDTTYLKTKINDHEFAIHKSFAKQAEISGTYSCIAPEVLQGRPVDEKSDIWALGIAMYELITLENPFYSFNKGAPKIPDQVPKMLQTVRQPGFLQTIFNNHKKKPSIKRRIGHLDPNHRLLKLSFECLNENPQKRPSITKLIERIHEISQIEKKPLVILVSRDFNFSSLSLKET